MIRRWIATSILIGAVGACGPFCGDGKLSFSNATARRWPDSQTRAANLST